MHAVALALGVAPQGLTFAGLYLAIRLLRIPTINYKLHNSYNLQLMREREMAMADPADGAAASGGNEGTNARNVKFSPSAKKAAAAERIGVNRAPR